MAYTMNAAKIFDAVAIAGGGAGTAVSAAIRMDEAVTMAIHQQANVTAGTSDITYTYELSTSNDENAVWITPVAPVTIGTITTATQDVLDFSPEAAKFIRITATNDDAAACTLTSVLVVQEAC